MLRLNIRLAFVLVLGLVLRLAIVGRVGVRVRDRAEF